MSFCNRQICPECGGEDCEIAQEISRLKAALKPVMECELENKMCRAISVKSDDDEMDARLNVSVWIDMSNAVSAVREAQRVMREFTNGESHN